MLRPLFTIGLIFSSAQAAQADACHDRFVELLTNGNDSKIPTKSHITTEPKGGKVMINEFYYQDTGHWMTVMLQPKQPWSMANNNVMYVSPDEGKNWKKIRTMDSVTQEKDTLAALAKNSKSSSNTSCSEEEFEGSMHEVVEGDYLHVLDSYRAEQHNKYWVNKETGWIRKTESISKSGSSEYKFTQVIEPVPDMALPTPTPE